MTFNDEDLKRLKASLSGQLPEFSTWAKSELEVLRALLARLEASERIMESIETSDEINFELLKAWRRTCGR